MINTFFRLVRLPNLLFLALLQFLMYVSVIEPIMMRYGFSFGENRLALTLLIAATALIAAGGYVLNDYFDVKIDAINKPDKQIVTQSISKKSAMLTYQILTAAGVICGLALSFWVRSFTLGFVFVLAPGALWFYSASYKRQFMIGNVVVAFISAVGVLAVALLQMAILQKIYQKFIFDTPIPVLIYAYVGGFAVFAFFCTWVREIIKDLEDADGDREVECRTMPIVWGERKTKIFTMALILLIIILLIIVSKIIPTGKSLTFKYILWGLIIPFAALGVLLWKSKTSAEYHQPSTFSKIIMLVGALYSLVFYYIIAKESGFPLFNMFLVK